MSGLTYRGGKNDIGSGEVLGPKRNTRCCLTAIPRRTPLVGMELLTLGLIKYPGMKLLKECQKLGINSQTKVMYHAFRDICTRYTQ